MQERLADLTESQVRCRFWKDQIKQSDKHEKDFRERGQSIIKRYRDEEKKAGTQRYALLWANSQLNMAALIGQIPPPDVSRRWVMDDRIIRDAAEIMQKAMAHPLDEPPAVRGIRDSVFESVLPGRGVLRVRYEATFEMVETGRQEQAIDRFGMPIMRPVMVETDSGELEPETEERKASERVYLQRVYWQDYRESIGRCPDDIWWRAFRHHMNRDELIEEFGPEIGKKIRLTVTSGQKGAAIDAPAGGIDDDEALPAAFGRAVLWEIWDKKSRKVRWISDGHDDMIREEPPAIDFERFYDCADSLVLYDTTDNNIPMPEYAFYQELALEVDALQERIAAIVSVLRIAGFYHPALKDLGDLTKVKDGTFLPTEQEMMFALGDGNPGLDRLIASLPIERWAQIVPLLAQRVEQLKQAIFEVTGFSDLFRGQTVASETLGAQNLKAQFGSFRLMTKQRAVQEWLEATYALVGEVVAEMFDAETIMRMTGLGEPMSLEAWIEDQGVMPETDDPVQAEQIRMQIEAGYQQYVLEEEQHFDAVMAFLRDNRMRSFRVNIELDELARPDRQAMQATQAEAMAQTTQFMQALQNVPQPIVPAMFSMFKAWVRNFKLGHDTEDLIDEALDGYPRYVAQIEQQQAEMQQRAEQMAQQPSPDAMVRAQVDQLKAELQVELQRMKAQADAAIEVLKAQLKGAEGDGSMIKAEADMELARMKQDGDTERALIKEAGAMDRELVKADVARESKMIDVAGTVAREAVRPAPSANGNGD